MKALVVLLLAFNISWAVCQQPVKYLSEGSTSPCSGYLFSPEQEQEVRLKMDRYSTLEKISAQQDVLIGIQNQRIELYQSQVMKLEEFFQYRKDREWYVNIGFFLGGAVLTAVIATNVNR